MRLHETTRHLLRNRPLTLTLDKIAQQTNLTKAWLKKFSEDNSPSHPSVNRVQDLYEFLSGKKLEL